MFRIEPFETPETAVKRIAAERFDRAITLLVHPEGNIDKAFFTTRKNLKRIRAILHLVRDDIGEENFRLENDLYGDAGRRLAPLRDSVVMVTTLNALCHHFQLPHAFSVTRTQVTARQAASRQQFIADTNLTLELASILQDGKQRFLALPIASPDFAAFGGLGRVYHQGQQLMNQAFTAPETDPVLFHEWRKHVKHLWFHLAILSPLWPSLFHVWVRELHHLSDLLGDGHDLAVLEECLLSETEQFTATSELSDLLPLLTQRRRELEDGTRPYGRRLYAEPVEAFVHRIGLLWQGWQAAN